MNHPLLRWRQFGRLVAGAKPDAVNMGIENLWGKDLLTREANAGSQAVRKLTAENAVKKRFLVWFFH